jgi:hypothetical protein
MPPLALVTLRWLPISTVVLLAFGAAVACSSSESDHASTSRGSGGSAATSGVGGNAAAPSGGHTTAGAGSNSLSPEELQTATAACVQYITAQCTRRSACSASAAGYDSCVAYQSQCPGVFLAPGSGYTVELLRSCAAEWSAFSCDDLSAGKNPSCVATGTRAAGEPCRFRAQCTSGICSAQDPAACGVCLNPVESGAPCQTVLQCPAHYLCSFGRCLQLQSSPPGDSLPNGSPCEYDGRCAGACAPTDLARVYRVPGEKGEDGAIFLG